MLVHAFLVVAALIEGTRHPAPPGLVAVTCYEVQHLFAALVAVPSPSPSLIPATDGAGRCGDDDIKHAPAAATTSDKPPSNDEHHDPRLD